MLSSHNMWIFTYRYGRLGLEDDTIERPGYEFRNRRWRHPETKQAPHDCGSSGPVPFPLRGCWELAETLARQVAVAAIIPEDKSPSTWHIPNELRTGFSDVLWCYIAASANLFEQGTRCPSQKSRVAKTQGTEGNTSPGTDHRRWRLEEVPVVAPALGSMRCAPKASAFSPAGRWALARVPEPGFPARTMERADTPGLTGH
jgi:hypothetical protein